MAVPLTRCVSCSAASLVCCHSRKLAGDRGHSESALLLLHEYKQLMLLVFKQALGGSSYPHLADGGSANVTTSSLPPLA